MTFEVMGKLSCAERETISAILRRLELQLAGEEPLPADAAAEMDAG